MSRHNDKGWTAQNDRQDRALRIAASDLGAVRGGRTVFAGLSFEVAAGELLAVVGPNGSGKSTLLRIVAGLLAPTAGRVAFDGPGDGAPSTIAHYLGHLDALKPALSVRENLDFWRLMWNGSSPEAALEAVGLAGLADLPAGVLSAGQRRRVAIARLLLVRRPVWLLDEPATALDEAAEAALGSLISAHLASGGIAMVATHRDLPLPATATLSLGAE